MPHTYIIIFGVILFAALLTVFIPLGKYDTKEITYMQNGVEKTRTVLDPESFQYILDENGNIETVAMYGYCTNDAKEAGHFSGRKISAMFRSIYKKLCPENHNQTGRYISHCNDWWGDGSGDMLFIRTGYYRAFEEWARQ